MSYEAWRISYQSSEQAARAAYAEIERLRNDLADALDCKAGAGPTALSMVIAERDTLRAKLAAAEARAERLLRGEFICQKCGLRKDGEHDGKPDF